jgi:ribosomal protein L20
MTRVKRGNVARKRRKKILKLAKGFRGSHSRLFRTANQQVMKALRNASAIFAVCGLRALMLLHGSMV